MQGNPRPLMGLVLVGAVILMALSRPSCAQGALDSGKKRPSQAVGEKILLLLSDKGKSDTQKAAELARMRGNLSPQATAPLLDRLRESDGVVFVALALCLERCGARKEALSVAEAILSEKSTPASQFAAVLRFITRATFKGRPGPRLMSLFKTGSDRLIERLRDRSNRAELLALLRARRFIWHRGTVWATRCEVIRELCNLVEGTEGKVQRAAARVLATVATPDLVAGTTVVPLARVALDCDPETAISINELLTRVLGAGPKTKEVAGIKSFWEKWLAENGAGFRLALYALKRAKASERLPYEERLLLGSQIAFSVRQLPEGERAKVWASLRQVFLADKSPPRERCAAWLRPLVKVASRERSRAIRRQCLSLLMSLVRSSDETLRGWALGSLGDLPEATAAGSLARRLLEHTLADPHAPPGDRARAAWSLRHAIRGNPDLAEKMIALAETFQRLPDGAFTTMSRSNCIGQICEAARWSFHDHVAKQLHRPDLRGTLGSHREEPLARPLDLAARPWLITSHRVRGRKGRSPLTRRRVPADAENLPTVLDSFQSLTP